MGNFFEELKNRNVYKVATAYAIFGWLIIQVVNTIGPNLNWPDSVAPLITKLLLVGFPIALVLAWLYEFTPKGLMRTGNTQENTSDNTRAGKRLNSIIIGALSLLVILLLTDKLFLSGPVLNNDRQLASIGVLPFINLSSDAENEYFADGLAARILDKLAQISGLKIPARTSSFQFKDKNLDVRQIGEQLDVNYLLEGSVQYEADQLRITVNLINAYNGYHLWSNTYNENLGQASYIQEDISRKVARELKVHLLPREEEQLGKTETNNEEAYKLYLQAVEVSQFRSGKNLENASKLLNEALKYDENFVLAHAALVPIYGRLRAKSKRSRDDLESLMKIHLDKALEIDSDLGEVYMAKGYYEFAKGDKTSALRSYEKAVDYMPSNSAAYRQIYWVNWSEDKKKAAYEAILKAFRLDPFEPMTAMQTGLYYYFVLEKYDKGIDIIEKVRTLDPDKSFGVGIISYMLISKPRGDLTAAFYKTYESYKTNPLAFAVLQSLSNSAIDLKIFPLAEKLIRNMQVKYPNHPETYDALFGLNAAKGKYRDNLDLTSIWMEGKDDGSELYYYCDLAWTNYLLGHYERAKEIYQSHFPEIMDIEKLEGKSQIKIGIWSYNYIMTNFVLDYILILRALNQNDLADRYSKVMCDYVQNKIRNQTQIHFSRALNLKENCLFSKANKNALVKFMDQRFFELKDRYNLYGLHAGNYKPLEGLASFKIFKNKVNKEIAQMQGEVIAFLKTEGEWDPTWNKEMGLE